MKKVTLLVAAALLAAMPAFGAQLLNEPFSYADGDLTTVSAGAWVAHSGAGQVPIQVVSGAAVLVQGAFTREDAQVAFAQQPVGSKTYACFSLVVSDLGTGPVASETYFVHFRPDVNFNFRARTFVVPPAGGGDYTLGLDADDSSVDVTWPSDLSFDTPYRVVISYDDATNSSELWVNPVSEASAKIVSSDGSTNTNVDALDRFSFRQAAGDSQQIIDDVTVGQAFSDVCDSATPTNSSSWGRLKTLYR